MCLLTFHEGIKSKYPEVFFFFKNTPKNSAKFTRKYLESAVQVFLSEFCKTLYNNSRQLLLSYTNLILLKKCFPLENAKSGDTHCYSL